MSEQWSLDSGPPPKDAMTPHAMHIECYVDTKGSHEPVVVLTFDSEPDKALVSFRFSVNDVLGIMAEFSRAVAEVNAHVRQN
jgi:hypothetical protein